MSVVDKQIWDDFERLEVWERTALLNAKLHCSLRRLGDFGFRAQALQAGVSTLNNIAEGLSQEPLSEGREFFDLARLSFDQLRECIFLAGERGYLGGDQVGSWAAEAQEIADKLVGLAREAGEAAAAS